MKHPEEESCSFFMKPEEESCPCFMKHPVEESCPCFMKHPVEGRFCYRDPLFTVTRSLSTQLD